MFASNDVNVRGLIALCTIEEKAISVPSQKRRHDVPSDTGYLDGLVGPRLVRSIDAELEAQVEPTSRSVPVVRRPVLSDLEASFELVAAAPEVGSMSHLAAEEAPTAIRFDLAPSLAEPESVAVGLGGGRSDAGGKKVGGHIAGEIDVVQTSIDVHRRSGLTSGAEEL